MKFKITKQEPKKLLSREEYYAIIEEEKTPSHSVLKEEIAKKTGKSAELIIIKKIEQKFGKPEIEAKFYIYGNQDALKKFEPKSKAKAAQAPKAAA